MSALKAEPGTYALVFRSDKKAKAQIGRRGHLDIEPGYYIYVGSAFGPGGVRARVSRHVRKTKLKHWHIDYLQGFVTPVFAWCSYEEVHLEHQWAQSIIEMKDVTAIKGFGCSDCNCLSHLFYAAGTGKSDITRLSRVIGGRIVPIDFLPGRYVPGP